MGPPRRAQGQVPCDDVDAEEARERQRVEREAACADWFASLPEGSLTEGEEELRLQLLQAVPEQGSARLSIVAQGEEVRKAKLALGLPKIIGLSHWIQQRLADEVTLTQDVRCGEKLLSRVGTTRGAEPVETDELEAFYAELPNGRFTDGELALRDAFLGALRRAGGRGRLSALTRGGEFAREVQQARAALLPKGAPLSGWLQRRLGAEVHVSEEPGGGHFAELVASRGRMPRHGTAAAAAALPAAQATKPPATKPLQLRQKPGARPSFYPQAAAVAEDAVEEEEVAVDEEDPPPQSDEDRLAEQRAEEEAQREAALLEKEANIQSFFGTLPQDELTAEEHGLRQGLLDALQQECAAQGRSQVRLSVLCQRKEVMAAKAALQLPPEVTVRCWIENRIGGEIVLSKDATGQVMAEEAPFSAQEEEMPAAEAAPAAPAKKSAEERDARMGEFFQGPLSAVELRLRTALHDSCAENGGGPMRLSALLNVDAALMSAWHDAKASWLALRPPLEASFARWVELRMRGEVSLTREPYVQLVRPKKPADRPGAPPKRRPSWEATMQPAAKMAKIAPKGMQGKLGRPAAPFSAWRSPAGAAGKGRGV